ncbi:thiol reductant ABC exporter subunit CydD [uncultured Roseibium sp.]|uniref:thiol reductant ABC exporter subunit CydD n=1 Tax=uncultured Roseibium sp. TaxID=1936171 RepID=UPI00261E06D3|nr:thiol reductant ABC exporter subunit CydD [uncultured Roseibium sp.]
MDAREGIAKDADNAFSIGEPGAADTKALNLAGVFLAVSDLLWIPQAGFLAWTLGTVLSGVATQERTLLASDMTPQLLLAAAAVVMIAIARVTLVRFAQTQSLTAARSIQSQARSRLLRATTTRSPSDSFPVAGAFAAHVVDQVDLLGPYYRNFIPQLMRLRLVPLAIVAMTAWYSWLAALILLVSGPLIPLFMALIGSRAKAASASQQEELTRLSGVLLDRIRGLETLKLFGALEGTKADIRDAGERFRTGTMKVLKIAFLSSTVLELFSALGIAFSAVYIGFSLLGDLNVGAWGTPLGFSQGLFILLLAPEFFAPLRAFSTAYHDRAAGIAAMQKLSLLLAEIETEGTVSASDLVKRSAAKTFTASNETLANPCVSFNEVSLEVSGRPIFSRFSLHVGVGETVLISGASGSGKTSLLDLILGYRKPDGGSVQINEVDANIAAGELRQHVMWLGQAPTLFHGSVKSNLLKGLPDPTSVSEADIWNALRLAGAENLVRRLPQGLATQLGEDGFGLSVGEIRRVALARAAMRSNSTILIADEPTAGLDPETARDVIGGLTALTRDRTALIATHDPAVLKLAGRRVDLDRVVEAGLEPVS